MFSNDIKPMNFLLAALTAGADSRKGVPGVRPPPLKFSKMIRVLIYIMTNMHIFRSILMSQLFTCLSLAIHVDCSVALISKGG